MSRKASFAALICLLFLPADFHAQPNRRLQGRSILLEFDRPETHAIRKGASLYYALFAPDWKGGIELRGLAPRSYRLTDYVEGKDLGTVRGPVGRLNVEFRRHLLLEARPE
jgi:alpha-galactosidase